MIDYFKIVSTYYPESIVSCDGDSTVYENLIFNGSPILKNTLEGHWLDFRKEERYLEINNRTDELIPLLGFSYDNETFKCGLEDRVNYGHIKQFESLLTFPIDIVTKDEGSYSLTAINLDGFISAAMTHVNTVIGQGAYFKGLIKAATTEAEIDAVIDNR